MARIPKKTNKISVYLTDYQYDQVYTKAALMGVGVSIIVNIAISEYIRNSDSYLPIEEMQQMKLDGLNKALGKPTTYAGN